MSYIILKKVITKRAGLAKAPKISYNPIDIVEDYEEARQMIADDNMLALSYTPSTIAGKYPDLEVS